ncbi:MAG TPA: hypothetical protein PLK55_02170 [archaeon]|nr:hypothetical protein [archaeon]
MNRKFLVFITIFAIVLSLNLIYASTLSVDKNETYLGDTVVITGTGFSPSSTLVLQNNLEPNSAWWDGYNEQWGFPTFVTTDESGNFTYNWTVPFDFRISPGKQYFSVGNNISATIYWNGGGDYPTSKNKTICDGNYCYVTSTYTNPNGGVEKFNMSTGARECNASVAVTGTGIAIDGTYIYTTYAATSNNLRRTAMADCTGTSTFTTAGSNTYSVAISNGYAFFGYNVNIAPRKYENLSTTPSQVVAFAPASRNSIANYICVTPDATKVVVGYADGNVLAFDYTTGATLWNSDPDDDVTQAISGMHCDNDKIYVAKAYNSTTNGPLFGGFAYALSASDGALVWRSERIDSHYVYSSYTNVACDSVNCYASVLSPPLGGAGINGAPIIQIDKTTGEIGWVKWRSWLPASTGDYGTSTTHQSPMDLWVDSDENGFIYPVYSGGRIQKLSKNDVSVQSFPDTNLWIRSNTNLYNFVMNPTKNVFYSNERPSFNFKAIDNYGQYMDADDNRFNTSHLKFSTINAYNEFTAAEAGSATVASQFMDPRIMSVYSATATLPNPTPYNYLKFMYDEYDSGVFCETAVYNTKLFGWHINNRYCLYENLEVNNATLNHTQNGVKLASIANYFLVNPNKWNNFPITKTFGTDNWTWSSSHNPTYDQILGYATRFGSDFNEAWFNQLGQGTSFNTNTGTTSLIDYIDATQDFNNADPRLQKWHESYFLFKPLGSGADGNRHWQYIENDTNMIATPITVVQGTNQSGSYLIGADTFSNRIDFNATEAGILERTNEPFWFDVNFIDSINSDCSDIVVTDITDTPIGLWQLDSETCTANNYYTLFVQDNFTLGQEKQYRLYYNSPTAAVTPGGTTDLITSLVSGTCAAGTDIIDVNSTNWYRWVQPGVGAVAANQLYFNFGGSSNTWFNHATTRYALRAGYLNSQSAGTGAGSVTNTLGTALATFTSRCYQRSYNKDKIFTRIDMNTANFTIAPHTPTEINPNATTTFTRKIMSRWYFFNGNGRIRIMFKLDEPLPVMTTGISQTYHPYFYFGMYALVPQGTATVAANNFVNWSGRKELMDEYTPVQLSPDKKSAILTPSPLPLTFTIDYNGEHFPTVSSASSKVGGGCTVHKVWPYFSWRPIDPVTTTNATTFASAYTTDFISCDEDLNGTIPDIGNDGYVNVFPKESIYGTGLNRFVDPNYIAKFYLKPNLYIPDNRENRWLPPLALNSQYGTSAKVSTIILDVCPTEEYGYKGYDDFLADLDDLISSSSIHKVEENTTNIPCATSITIFSTNTGSIGKYFLFQRDVNVVVADVSRPDAPYPSYLYDPTTGALSINGSLDYTNAQKSTQYLGKWFFTSSSDPYVISGYATTGAEQLQGAKRYAWAPSFAFNKKVYSENLFWNKSMSNLTYQQSPCAWNFSTNYWGDMDFGPGWKKTMSTTQQGTICPRNESNMEHYSSFRMALASLYPANALVVTAIDNVIDGRPNKVTTINDLGIDASMFSRHNSLWDYNHYSDYTQVLSDFSELTEGTKHSNDEPWQCDFSRYDSKNFCIVPATTTTLIYTATPGVLTASTTSGMWSPYYQSNREYSVLRNYFNNVWFNTAAMFPTYDFLTENTIFPMLGETEFTYDTLYTSNNPNDYNDLMDKLFPRLHGALYQNQFLLRDWKNTAFMVLSGGDTREYLRGTTINVSGFMMKDSDSLANAPIIVQVFKNSAPESPLTTYQTITDANGDFNYSYTITPTAEPGLYFFKAIYNNGEITGTTSFKVSALNIATVLDKSVYVAGDSVFVTTTISDAIIGDLISDATVNLVISGPAGNTLLTTPMTNAGFGVYTYSFQLSPETVNGTYVVTITATTADNTGSATTTFGVGVAVSSINIINNFQISDANIEYVTQVTTLQNVVATPLLEFTINYQLSGGLDLENITLFTKDDIVLERVYDFDDLNRTTYYLSLDSSNNPIVYIMANFEASQIRTMTFIAENKYYEHIEQDYNSVNNYSSELSSYCSILLTPAAQADCANANTYLIDINDYYTQAQTASSIDQFYNIKIAIGEKYILFMDILDSLRILATNQASCQIFVPGTWSLDSNVSFAVLMNGPSSIPINGLTFDVNLFNYNSVLVDSYSVDEYGEGWYYSSFSTPSTGGGYNLRIDQNIGTNRFQCAASFDVNQASGSVIGGEIGGGLTADQNATLYEILGIVTDINATLNDLEEIIFDINAIVTDINSTVSDIDSRLSTLETSLSDINLLLTGIDSNINYIIGNMATTTDITNLDSTLQTILGYNVDINQTVHDSATQLNNLYDLLDDIDDQIDAMNNTITDINALITTCENAPETSICADINGLSNQLNNINSTIDIISSTTQDINSTTSSMQGTINTLNNTSNSILSTVTDINNTSTFILSKVNTIESNTQDIQSNITTIMSDLNCAGTPPEYSVCGNLLNISSLISDFNISTQLSLLDISNALSTIEYNQQDINQSISYILEDLNCEDENASPICSSIQTIIDNTDTLETSISDLNNTMIIIGDNVLDINSNTNNVLLGISDLNSSNQEILDDLLNISEEITNTQGLISDTNLNLTNYLYDINDTVDDINDTVDDIGGTTGGTSDKVDEIKDIVLNIDNNVSEINTTLTDINTQQQAIQATLASMQLTLSDINDTTTNIYTDQQSRFTVAISDFSEIGSGDVYRAKVWVFDYDGSPKDADSNDAKITLYDPERNIITENITMTRLSEGVYTYDYNVGTGQIAGIWEAVATVLVNGENVSPSDFWELVGNPPEVRINSIVDTSIPTITADVIITNEGSASQEYQYEYCIVSDQSNMCGGGDDVDYSSGAKLILPGQTWNTELTLNVPTVGTYWFKIKVYYGVEMSAASKQFVATTGGTNTGGTGGGSSDISDVTGLVSLPVAVGEIAIIEYPTDMTIIQGDYGFYTLRIKNIGSIDLSDIKLTIEDLPESWWEIQQEKTILSPNEEGSFVIKLKAPMDAEVKDTLVKFKISSKEDTRLRESILRVLEKSLAEIRFVDVKVSPIKVNGYGEIEFIIQNMSLYDQNITATLLVPRDWQIEDSDQAIILKGGETKRIIFVVNASYISGVRDLVFVIKNNTGQRFKTGEDKLFKQLMVIVINDEKVKSELNFFNQFNGIGIGILIIILLLVILIIIFLFGIKNNKKQRPSLGYNRNILDKLMGLRRK